MKTQSNHPNFIASAITAATKMNPIKILAKSFISSFLFIMPLF
jgi:hypothetical protein